MTAEQLSKNNNDDDGSPPPPVLSINSGDENSASSATEEEFPTNGSFESQVMDRSDEMIVDQQEQRRSIMMGAGVLTGLVGCVMCGPLGGCLMGTGAAVGTYRPTPAGQVARSVGQCAVSCATCSQRKATALDAQHDVSGKARQVSAKVQGTKWYQKSTGFYDSKAKPVAAWTWGGLKEVNSSYRIVDRSWAAMETTLDYAHLWVIGEKPKADEHTDVSSSSSGSHFSIDEEEDAVGQEMKEGRSLNGYASVETSNTVV